VDKKGILRYNSDRIPSAANWLTGSSKLVPPA
jgi:hypothetical protein